MDDTPDEFQLASAASNISQIVDSPFPLTRLPSELISYIFETAVSSAEDPDRDEELSYVDSRGIIDIPVKASQAAILAAISSGLRRIALNTPSIWVYLFENMPLEGLDVLTLRSRRCPLHIRIIRDIDMAYVEDESDGVDQPHWSVDLEAIRRLCEHSARWHTFLLAASVSKLLMPYAAPLPMLRYLFVANDTDIAESENPKANWKRRLAAWSMPSISSYAAYFAVPTHLPIPTLKKIYLAMRSPDALEQVAPTIEAILNALSALAQLEEASFLFMDGIPIVPVEINRRPPHVLAHLTTLRIWISHMYHPYHSILDRLQVPNLHTLTLRLHPASMDNAMQALAHAQRIETLELMHAGASNHDDPAWQMALSLATVFGRMRSLRTFRVERLPLHIQADETGTGLTMESIPPALQAISFIAVEINIVDLRSFLSILRESLAWPLFTRHSISLEACVDEIARSADFDDEVAAYEGKVRLLPTV